jgi:hypothetical protein
VIPANFTEFFVACAGVSGALIGLLFVAISVAPEKLSSESENVEHQIKAASAFSALTNGLLVALFALIPDGGLGEAAFILACVGVASTVGLAIFFQHNRSRAETIRLGQAGLIAGMLLMYVLQLLNGVRLWHSPHNVSYITAQANILVVFFIIAIARAWDLVGARDTGLLAGVVGLARERHPEGGDAPGAEG